MIQVPVMTIDSSKHQFPNPKIGWSGFGGPFHAVSGPCRVKSKTIVVELCLGGHFENAVTFQAFVSRCKFDMLTNLCS